MHLFYFFFSSRRRHTRLQGDWSSDVCSSDLYARRWKIELHLDDLKTTLGLDQLSRLSPTMVEKELQMHAIAYNLIRSLMAEAASTCAVPLDRLSFKGTL